MALYELQMMRLTCQQVNNVFSCVTFMNEKAGREFVLGKRK